MGEIRLPGLATGIDTSSIIAQLMEVNKRRLYMYQENLKKTQEKKDSMDELQGKLSSFQAALKSLSDSSQLKSYKAATSDSDVITATANSNAFEGNHTVEINQLATSERWVHSGFSNNTTYVGAGTIFLSYNNQELRIQTNAETTLDDLVGLINNDQDNPGVNASLLKYDEGSGNAYHLVLGGQDSGGDYQIAINTSNTELWTADSTLLYGGENAAVTTKLVDLDSFSGTMESGSTADRIHITGDQHDGTPVDVYFDVTSHTTIEDILREIETAFDDTVKATYKDGAITITDTTSGTSNMTIALSFVPGVGSSASLTLPTFSQSTAGGSESSTLTSLLPANWTQSQDAQDSQIRIDGYPAGNWISRSSNTIDDVISGVTLHLHDTTDGTPVEVNLTRDTEALKEKIQEMVTQYNTVVMYIQEKTAFSPDGKTRGIFATDYFVSTIWSQIKSPFSGTVAGFDSDDSFLHPEDIGLDIGADGMLELDETKLDEAIVDDYLGVLSLMGALKTGDSDSTKIKFYSAATSTVAGSYYVKVIIDGAGTITSAKIWSDGQTEADARDATIDNDNDTITGSIALTGSNKYLYGENNLQFTVDTTNVGQTLTATIDVKQGFAGAVYDIVETMLNSVNGSVPVSQDALQDTIDNHNARIEREETRLEKIEERLIAQYARLERNLQMINQQMAGLNML
ncbi:MAG: flagellar filament capping protein FliD [Sedimentisphaerales bacterium]|nr:flagellar filament capping protein FliD [Sedimentisphaerales bacterium]